MALLEPIEVTEGGKTFKRIRPNTGKPFWGAMVVMGTTQIVAWTDENEEPIYSIDAPIFLDGFGMYVEDGRQAFEDEIDNRGWTRPIENE